MGGLALVRDGLQDFLPQDAAQDGTDGGELVVCVGGEAAVCVYCVCL